MAEVSLARSVGQGLLSDAGIEQGQVRRDELDGSSYNIKRVINIIG